MSNLMKFAPIAAILLASATAWATPNGAFEACDHCKCGESCKCGPNCKCADGKCGENCKCGEGKCGPDCKCGGKK
jgi:hypothetical protein